jgi:hypothetical protein
MHARAEQGSLAFSIHAFAVQAAVSTARHNPDAMRAAVEVLIGELVTVVATGLSKLQ